MSRIGIVDKHRTVNLGDLRKEFQGLQEKGVKNKETHLGINADLAWLQKAQEAQERKKVQEFSFEEGQWGKSKLIYVPGDNGQKVIQGGSLGDLVSYLIENQDDDYIETFLFVHTYFVPSLNLLSKLQELFHSLPPEKDRLSADQERVLKVIHIWITHHWYYFANNKELQDKLQDLLNSLVKDVNIKEPVGALKLHHSEELKDVIEKTKLFSTLSETFTVYDKPKLLVLVLNKLQKSNIVKVSKKRLRTVNCVVASEAVEFLVNDISISKETATNLLRSIVEAGYMKHATGDLKSFVDGNHLYKIKERKQQKQADAKERKDQNEIKSVMDMSAIEAACQLTVSASNLFRQVSPLELMHQGWANGSKDCPHILQIIQRFNEISYWVATEIVREENLKARVEVIKRFILIADHCRQLVNFSTMMEIIVGLNLAAVQRLEKTWLSVPPKYMQIYQNLMNLTSSSQNYKAYREHIASLGPTPIVPYIGVYLRDLTFVEDGNDTFLSTTKIINFEKMRMLDNIFREIANFQSQSYNIKVDNAIAQYLTKDRVILITDEELRAQSLKCEPSKRRSIAMDEGHPITSSASSTNIALQTQENS